MGLSLQNKFLRGCIVFGFCFIPVVCLLVKQTYNISKMIFPKEMMMDSVWTERPAYVEAEEHYQLYLDKNLTVQVTSSHAKTDDDEAAKQKDRAVPDSTHVTKLEEENKAMKKLIEDLCQTVKALELRVGKLEAGTSAPAAAPAKATPAKKEDSDDDDDDDIDLFDSDEEEETEEEKKKKEELLKKYHEKKAKKPALIPKSSIVLDVKPWDDETDMAEMERLVRTVAIDGMVWGWSKLVPLAYGIKKLQISCVVEDDKCGSDILIETIQEFEDFVQSVDVHAFNKI